MRKRSAKPGPRRGVASTLPPIKTCRWRFLRAALCRLSGLLFGLFVSFAVAQPATDLSSDDASTPDPALSPEQVDSLPVESPGYTRPEPALSPEQINPPPVESVDYTPPDPALSPEQTDSPPSDDSPG